MVAVVLDETREKDYAAGSDCLLLGPAGCGKSAMARHRGVEALLTISRFGSTEGAVHFLHGGQGEASFSSSGLLYHSKVWALQVPQPTDSKALKGCGSATPRLESFPNHRKKEPSPNIGALIITCTILVVPYKFLSIKAPVF